MYSQNNEEQYIVNFFTSHRSTEKFLDIGAYNGKKFSNTCRLGELGWSGLCLEPSPIPFDGLVKLYAGNNKVICVNAAVTDTDGENEFWVTADALSTNSQTHKEKWEKAGAKFIKAKVKTYRLETLMSLYGDDFAFLNIDIEGESYNLFSQLPFEKFPALQLICVEHDDRIEPVSKIANKYGFRLIHKNNENLILGKL